MKIVSKITLVLALCFSFSYANAQSIIVKAGLNMSNMESKTNSVTFSDDFKMRPGFHVGVAAEVPIISGMSVEPGILFGTKGYKYEGKLHDGTFKLNYIDIPVNLKYKLEAGPVAVFGAVGPYLGIGISGESDIEVVGLSGTYDVKFGDDDDELKTLDFGLDFGGGVEVGSFVVGVYYYLGLSNLSNVDFDDKSDKNRVLSLSLGYKFGF